MSAHTPLIARDDTFLGICQGLGEDLGIGPNWLRLGLALLLFWSPLAAIGLYAAGGALLLTARLIVREPRRAASVPNAAEAASGAESLDVAPAQAAPEEVALAA